MAGIAALSLAYIFSQFYRSFLAVIAPVLTEDLGVDAADLGRASGAWFLAFAVMQLPVGVWLDRAGPRRTAGWLFGVCAGGGAVVFAFAQGAGALIFAMTLIGAGCAPVLMASFYIFARRFDGALFATFSSSLVGFGTLGNIGAAEPLAEAVLAFGWRGAMGALAVGSILTAIAVLALVDDPERVVPEDDRGFADYSALIRMRVLWPILALMFVNYMPAAGIRGLWAGPYLADVHGLDASEVGRATLWMAIAMSLGAFAYGPADRIFGTRKWVIFFSVAVSAAACAVLAVRPTVSADVATILFIVIGGLGACYAVVMAHGRAFFPAHRVGRGVTLMNFLAMGGVGVAQVVTGEVAARFETEAGVTAEGYAAVFGLYAVACAATLCIYVFARDAPPGREVA